MGNWGSTLWEPVRGWRKLRLAPMKVWRSWGAPLPYWIRVPLWHFLPALCRLSTTQGERAALRQRKWSAWVTNLSVSTRTVLQSCRCSWVGCGLRVGFLQDLLVGREQQRPWESSIPNISAVDYQRPWIVRNWPSLLKKMEGIEWESELFDFQNKHLSYYTMKNV